MKNLHAQILLITLLMCSYANAENTVELPFSIHLSSKEGEFLDPSGSPRSYWGSGFGIGNKNKRGFNYHGEISLYRITSGNDFAGSSPYSLSIEGGYRAYSISKLPIYAGLGVGYEKVFMDDYYDFCNCNSDTHGFSGIYFRPYAGFSLNSDINLDFELGYKPISGGSNENVIEFSLIARPD